MTTKKAAVPQHVAALGANFAADDELMSDDFASPPKKVAQSVKPLLQKRVWIVLEDNDQIPPGGQFLSADGRGYLLQPGVEAEVPMCIISILDTAITDIPVTDLLQRVVSYKKRLRFPYRVVTEAQRAAHAEPRRA